MAERVVITGLGIVSSLGCDPGVFWSNLTKGKSGISKIASFDTSSFECHYGGEVKEFTPFKFSPPGKRKVVPRSHGFALSASLSALKESGVKSYKEIGVALSSIAGGMEFVEGKSGDFNDYPVYMSTANIHSLLGLGGAAFTLSSACAGGNYAISLAYEKISKGEEKIMLAGGVDYFSEGVFWGFCRLFSVAPFKCQPFDKNRKGLIPAEGAGMLVLESLSSAKNRKANIYAEVLGYGVSADAYHPVIPSEEGFYRCMRDALDAVDLGINDIDYISAHGTGTPINDRTECQAIRKLFGKKRYKEIPVSSIKSMLGHTMGAASAIEAIACCFTLKYGLIPPTINYENPDPECDIDCVPNVARKQKIRVLLNNSFGFGGMNSSLVLAA